MTTDPIIEVEIYDRKTGEVIEYQRSTYTAWLTYWTLQCNQTDFAWRQV
jgi:hypothetical protein